MLQSLALSAPTPPSFLLPTHLHTHTLLRRYSDNMAGTRVSVPGLKTQDPIPNKTSRVTPVGRGFGESRSEAKPIFSPPSLPDKQKGMLFQG